MGTGQLDIDANLRGIGHVLRDTILTVPAFQRNYSWTIEQVDEYWFDLRAALSANQPYYFMGTVVVSRESSPSAIVIDGQQRLATTSLLLAAIRDVLADGNEANRASALQVRYLTAWSLADNVEEPRLELNEADREYFRSAVLHHGNTVSPADRPLLSAAFAQLRRHVRIESESAGPHWVERLLQWVDFLDKRAQVIFMETANDGDAFMVFETLNDRGLPLAVADVLKNYLLGLARVELDTASELWLSAVQAIEDSRSRDSLTVYFRHWWNARNGATRERDLYSFVRSAIRSEDQALDALRQLAHQAPIYAALTDPTHLLWEDQSEQARMSAKTLVNLGLEQYRPLGLAVLSELPPPAAASILHAAVGWSVRALIVGGAGGGTAERLYSEAAVRVSNGRSEDVESVYSDVSPLVARDPEFEAAFASRRIHRSATVKYLLHAMKNEASLVEDNESLVAVALFPRADPLAEWSEYATTDELSGVAGRLGNFVLLTRDEARRVPSSPEARFEFLTESALGAGGALEPWREFTIDAVGERQRRMAARASTVWPVLPADTTGRDA